MYMKRSLTFLLMLCGVIATFAQAPTFSTTNDPVYYKVYFTNGGTYYIADKGAGNNIQTAASVSNEGCWALIGSADSFVMLSKNGNYIYKNGSYMATTSTASQAISLKLVDGNNGNYEIQAVGGTTCFNMWGGAGTGKSVGLYNKGDNGNQLKFEAAQSVLPTFSDETTEQYYFIKSNLGAYYLADTGLGEPVRTSVQDKCDEQLWKFVGDQDNFQIVNQAGHYMYLGGASLSSSESGGGVNNKPLRTQATASSTGFRLIESSVLGCFQIQPTDQTTQALNVWGGSGTGKSIGIWNTGDTNNNFTFVKAEDVAYNDYKIDGATNFTPEHKLTLWYTFPATLGKVDNPWMEYALPIGDGQFGGSVLGGLKKDQIVVNEKTLWRGNSNSYYGSSSSYQYLGDVYAETLDDEEIGYSTKNSAKDYVRYLDLEEAVAGVQYSSQNGGTYKHEYIASNPARLIVARYTAENGGKINRKFTFVSSKPGGVTSNTTYSNGEGYFGGKMAVVSFNGRFRVVPTDGTLTTTSDGIEVRDATEVLVFIAGGTDFDINSSTYVSNTNKLWGNVKARIDAAATKSWDELRSEHVADFQNYFNACTMDIGGENTKDTKSLVDSYGGTSSATDLMLEQLYFAYGRYLSIASSRGVDLPNNLQGIWANKNTLPWNSDIHTNINVEMNYWPCEPTNMSDMHVPFLNEIIKETDTSIHTVWKSQAQQSGQSRGWTVFTEQNIFGRGSTFKTNYVIANAWYVTHLWQHYRYTLDKDFLKRAFPAMVSCTQYWLDRLVLASDGTYECPNEWSPEHGPGKENAVAHAQQLVRELFDNTKEAAEILNAVSEGLMTQTDWNDLINKRAKLDLGLATETYTGNWGTGRISTNTTILREWKYSSYTSGENNHRHHSHLMCLYPYSQVQQGTPLFTAAVNSLKLRGDASTGWSMGWKMNLWARALDGDHAHTIIKNALRHSTSYGTDQSRGGIYYNLFDSHAPFQIDGNFGATAGMAELLMQSHTDTIHILPALPAIWKKKGNIKGMKAIGDFTVSIDWEKGKATNFEITSNQGTPLYVRYTDIGKATDMTILVDGAKTEPTVISDNVISIPTTAGQTAKVYFGEIPTSITTANASEGTSIMVKGRTISTTDNVVSIEVSDLQGRSVKKSSKNYVKVPESAGNIVIAKVTTRGGNTLTRKVAL